ncbi:hypothetical protein TEA_024567 [Camellia sinensis var. sinensis]|uniref:NPH3 domain-containing protein n=1 Tax=Camellia sinensis var. sinensis TaxID=542762 RepID=A0A4S4EP33_CAMSN|nr:hypothetical protein TEA_024567 [Camellia sinensis var. sinensis]
MPKCINSCYNLESFWKTWHASFNKWLARYMYISLGGSQRKLLNVWVIFTFVPIWHDLEWKLLSWAWLACVFFILEMLVKSAAKSFQGTKQMNERTHMLLLPLYPMVIRFPKGQDANPTRIVPFREVCVANAFKIATSLIMTGIELPGQLAESIHQRFRLFYKRESCSSVDSEEFEPEALVDSGVAHRKDNSEVKTGWKRHIEHSPITAMVDLNQEQTASPTGADMSAKKKELLSTAMKRTSEWIFSQEIPSDVTVHIGAASFSLHKFPLVSKCGYIRKMVTKSSDINLSTIDLPHIPGGAEAFELAAKFCYGINFEISTENIATLRCVAEHLEMTEDYAVSNLVGRTEAYLNEVALKSLAGAISILHSSENLFPTAEETKLVSRCIDAIAYITCRDSQFCAVNRAESGTEHLKSVVDWWADNLTVLRIDIFHRVLIAMMARGFKQYALGPILMLYAQKSLRGLEMFGTGRKKIEPRQEHEKRVVLETIVSLLPRENNSMSAHPALSDMERKKVCSLMDCQKLSREACAHAAQNDRLPVQTVVQVLFYEQQRLREAMDSGSLTSGLESPALPPKLNLYTTDHIRPLKRENQELKFELVKMKMKLKEMEKPTDSPSPSDLSASDKPSMPRKSFIGTVSRKLGRLYPFLRGDGFITPKGQSKPSRDRRHSIS